jgi:2-amino-4-hydroxy-6-hydroxymethyldihydropteridine diphosphokinase
LLLGSFSVSCLYKSGPVGYLNQPDFLDVVCVGHTAINPTALLFALAAIQRELGRTRSFPNAPRTIDILAYGDQVLDTPDLILAHPRLHQRAFVLVPLSEIAPTWRHPVFRKTAAELLSAAGPLERIKRVAPHLRKPREQHP